MEKYSDVNAMIGITILLNFVILILTITQLIVTPRINNRLKSIERQLDNIENLEQAKIDVGRAGIALQEIEDYGMCAKNYWTYEL